MYTKENIKDYQNRLTEEQKEQLLKHSNKYGIAPVICAWYDDIDDFNDDWLNLGLSQEEVTEVLSNGSEQGEFLELDNYEIIRLEM